VTIGIHNDRGDYIMIKNLSELEVDSELTIALRAYDDAMCEYEKAELELLNEFPPFPRPLMVETTQEQRDKSYANHRALIAAHTAFENATKGMNVSSGVTSDFRFNAAKARKTT
jgi:hypothetical protein